MALHSLHMRTPIAAIHIAAAIALVCIMLSLACLTVPEVEDSSRNHMLVLDKNGSVVPLGKPQRTTVVGQRIQMGEEESDSICAPARRDQNAGLCDVLEGLDAKYGSDRRLHLFLFVHGGMNSHETAIERVKTHLTAIEQGGSNADFYPLYVIWNSEAINAYGDHLARLRRGGVGVPASYFSSPVYLITDLIQASAGLPRSWFVQGFNPFRSRYQNWSNPCLHIEPPKVPHRLADRVVAPAGDHCGRLASFLPNLSPTTVFKLVSTPIADELGHSAWIVMRRRADLLIRRSVSSDDGESDFGSDVGGLGVLLREISARIKEEKWAKSSITIDLLGHSMGAIVVNEIVRLFPDLPIKKVVHMASADSLRNLEDSIIPYLRAHDDAEFYNLMLHPEREDHESNGWNAIPTGSLLTWIDNLYTSPPTRLDRTSGRWDNVGRWIDRLPKGIEKQMCFRVFPHRGQAIPTTHGGFDDLREPGATMPQYWMKDFWTGGECATSEAEAAGRDPA